jgi:hypothetical protein
MQVRREIMIEKKSVAGFALIALTFTVGVQCAEERMRAGLWEMTTTVENETGSLGKTCYTPAMVVVANMPEQAMREATEKMGAKRGCTLKEFKIVGNKLSTVNVCRNSSSAVTSTYSGDTFDTVDTHTEAGVSKVIHMKGRRVGDCK